MVIGRARTKCVSLHTFCLASPIIINFSRSAHGIIVIKPPPSLYLHEHRPKSLKFEGYHRVAAILDLGFPLKKSKVLISTFRGVLGQNKSKKIFLVMRPG